MSISRIRGQLNSYIQIAVFSGILAGFIFGSYVSYEVNPILMISITVIYFIAFFWIPESPQFLIRKKKIEVSSVKWIQFREIIRRTEILILRKQRNPCVFIGTLRLRTQNRIMKVFPKNLKNSYRLPSKTISSHQSQFLISVNNFNYVLKYTLCQFYN